MEKDNENQTKKQENNEEDMIVGGYGYWKRDGDLINNERFIPKPVNKNETQKSDEGKTSLGSAWNKAGTWEEKHYSKKVIEEYFNDKLKEKTFPGFVLTGIYGYSGDVSIIK